MLTKKVVHDIQEIVGKSAHLLRKDIEKNRKEFKEEIETAVAQIMESFIKYGATKEDLKKLATKEDLNMVRKELKGDINSVREELKGDIKDLKRDINDLKADTPTPQEFQNHEKKISKLETAVFPQ